MQKGSIVLNRKMTTQLGDVIAEPGTQLVSVFLGAVKTGEDPEPERRLHDLGFRQMAVYQTEFSLNCCDKQVRGGLIFSGMDGRDALGSAVRYANNALAAMFAQDDIGAAAPFIQQLTVGLVEVGPIDKDGNAHQGDHLKFFDWCIEDELSLDEYLDQLQTS